MTASPDVLQAIADLREDLTEAEMAALALRLDARTDARVEAWSTYQDAIDALDASIAADAASITQADAALAAAETSAAQKDTAMVGLQAAKADAQARLAAISGPATPDEVAELAEIQALAAQVGVTLP